ncbi:MAG: 4-hydroxythreonine-4-phosphate dehydrogenase PdxA [Acetobacterales bacterium]
MLPLAVTMGDPAGVGGDVALTAWTRLRSERAAAPFLMIDEPDRLVALAQRLGLDVPVVTIDHPHEAVGAFPDALPVLSLTLSAKAEPGRPAAANARAVIASIDRAIDMARDGEVAGIVTSPIHKKSLLDAGFAHAGHTDYLADRLGLDTPPVMMLACPALRVVPVTVHVSLREALARLDTAMIVTKARITAAALRHDFGIREPRLAISGLNPHAGEEGALGREEIELIAPAVRALAEEGIHVTGPHAADTLFAEHWRSRYDVAICMYHDQALIPLKTLDFEGGVNVTLGLPIVRTSPDHGTAFPLAGTGRASAVSMIAAIRMASAMAARRHSLAEADAALG